jgi:hypothetical protein
MMSDLDIVAAREEVAEGIGGCIARLSVAVRLLTLAQRVELAEKARNLADALDEGRVIDATRGPKRRRFVRTQFTDGSGAPLYKLLDP